MRNGTTRVGQSADVWTAVKYLRGVNSGADRTDFQPVVGCQSGWSKSSVRSALGPGPVISITKTQPFTGMLHT